MTPPRLAALLLTCLLAPAAHAQPKPGDVPTSVDARLVVEPFAAAPDVVHPIALDFDAKGRLLVVESHTHFRPAKYDGPKFDRVRVLEDTDGDGKADRFTTYFEGTTHTMDLAAHPDGSVYLATRNELLRLRDTDGDGKADEKTRLMFLETKGSYPHNGLSGIAFDSRGGVYFGMGENLGEPYTLMGADGKSISGGGEGGNVFHCTSDGKDLRRVATGFWNPFGACLDIYGRLFVVDNDPDASPPCRLLHVVEGGDYGFQFRYGRSGRHVFQAWNGELPGTLPMVAGTGESPCEVVSYESDGLPNEYRGDLLVPAWADHRLERYVLKPKGASFTADRKTLVQGGKDFYPSGMAVAPDGSLFVTDWGSRSYELHGKGAVWHVRWKDAKPSRPADPQKALLSPDRATREKAARELAKDEKGLEFLRGQLDSKDVRVRATVLVTLIDCEDKKVDFAPVARTDSDVGIRVLAVRGLLYRDVTVQEFLGEKHPISVRAEAISGLTDSPPRVALPALLADTDPFVRHVVVRRLTIFPKQLLGLNARTLDDPRQRIGLLLAWRGLFEWQTADEDRKRILTGFLNDPDPDVRFMAVKWVADERLTAFRPQIEESLKDPKLDPRAFVALTTALARLDNKPASEDALAGYFLERLRDKSAPAATRLAALKAVPATHPSLKTDLLTELLRLDDALIRVEALRAMKDRPDPKAVKAIVDLICDPKQPVAVRAQALVTLAAMPHSEADLLIELAGDKVPALRHEALRALVGVKLTGDQQSKLEAAVKDKPDCSDLAARVLGKPFHADRPPATDTAAWLKRLDGPADPDAGRRVFESATVATCSRCHRVEGRGANVGPDLSLVGRTDRKWIAESVLQPGAAVAPHYQTWKVETADGRSRTGLLVRTYLDESEYVDEKGDRFKVLAGEAVETTAVRNSIMPDGLLDRLTDQEARDVVAYLMSRK